MSWSTKRLPRHSRETCKRATRGQAAEARSGARQDRIGFVECSGEHGHPFRFIGCGVIGCIASALRPTLRWQWRRASVYIAWRAVWKSKCVGAALSGRRGRRRKLKSSYGLGDGLCVQLLEGGQYLNSFCWETLCVSASCAADAVMSVEPRPSPLLRQVCPWLCAVTGVLRVCRSTVKSSIFARWRCRVDMPSFVLQKHLDEEVHFWPPG